jgi:hypothetical protein
MEIKKQKFFEGGIFEGVKKGSLILKLLILDIYYYTKLAAT